VTDVADAVDAELVAATAGAAGAKPSAPEIEDAVTAGDPPPPQPRPAAAPVVIDVRDLGVRYSLRFTKKTTLRQSFVNLLRRDDRPTDFWALREVTFQVVHGESLAVIGPNGAGKSTLLQALAGIITPSAGVIDVRGQVSSLLTLGAGFDQDLTGRENIWLAGAFMGMSHTEMARRIEGIVEFADIGLFIDAPIKTYSSGMRARLGFSIATSVDPDILLLDEVLATGDEVFRAKSKARVIELVRAAKAIVLVTHDMNWVTEFCNRAMLLEQGRVVAEGAPAEVVRIHREHSASARAKKLAEVAAIGGAPKSM
jgi:homopolymeric O-antigen transport system ATP-binding protein